MSIFEAVDFDDHEQVLFVKDPETKLQAIIAIHNTRLGPALGGCRMWPYKSDQEAIADVLRLSRGMTYKAAMVNVALGGGKSVIIGDSHEQKTPELLQAMGRAIDSLQERYIVGEDIGTNPQDMAEIRKSTRCVTCLRVEDGGYGDPAPMTALGVFQSMTAGIEKAFGCDSFKNVRVSLQGVGNVGLNLCGLLNEAGAKLTVSDVRSENCRRAVDEFNAKVIAPDKIYDVDCEVFAPCAMGGILNDDTIPKLSAKVVAGAANNQLGEARHGQVLADHEILYLPDYVANGGGLVSCAAEWYRHDLDEVVTNVRKIYSTCKEILSYAEAENLTTAMASDSLAEKRIETGLK